MLHRAKNGNEGAFVLCRHAERQKFCDLFVTQENSLHLDGAKRKKHRDEINLAGNSPKTKETFFPID